MSRTLIYPNVTPEVWDELKANVAKDTGIVHPGEEGQGKVHGIDYSYRYDAGTQVLTITESGSILTEGLVAHEISDGIKKLQSH